MRHRCTAKPPAPRRPSVPGGAGGREPRSSRPGAVRGASRPFGVGATLSPLGMGCQRDAASPTVPTCTVVKFRRAIFHPLLSE